MFSSLFLLLFSLHFTTFKSKTETFKNTIEFKQEVDLFNHGVKSMDEEAQKKYTLFTKREERLDQKKNGRTRMSTEKYKEEEEKIQLLVPRTTKPDKISGIVGDKRKHEL